MAVVQGHAARRRANIAPNTLVMAQYDDPAGPDTSIPCPVKGCASKAQDMVSRDLHVALKHPRHPEGAAARSRLV